MHNDIAYVLYSEQQLKECCKRLARQIEKDYAGKDLVCVCILKGGVMFMTDLLREINLPLSMEFMAASSYGSGTTSAGSSQAGMSVQRFSRRRPRARICASAARPAAVPAPSRCAVRVNPMKNAYSVGSHIINISPAHRPSQIRTSLCWSRNRPSASAMPHSSSTRNMIRERARYRI